MLWHLTLSLMFFIFFSVIAICHFTFNFLAKLQSKKYFNTYYTAISIHKILSNVSIFTECIIALRGQHSDPDFCNLNTPFFNCIYKK